MTTRHLANFNKDGFVVLPRVLTGQVLANVVEKVNKQLVELKQPIEYEADVGYPGAPFSREASGGSTPRRLLGAIDRDPGFFALANTLLVGELIRGLMHTSDILVSRVHHNCIMTKHPSYSSDTLWHRDYRYWNFDEPNLISAWFSLSHEYPGNGGLKLIPSSHKMNLSDDRFDEGQFLQSSDPANRELIKSSVDIRLEAGDVLLFHCQLLHAANRNRSTQQKTSVVFTYHQSTNQPTPGTRSASLSSVRLEQENTRS